MWEFETLSVALATEGQDQRMCELEGDLEPGQEGCKCKQWNGGSGITEQSTRLLCRFGVSHFVLYVRVSHLNIVFQITNPRKIKQLRTIQPETARTKMTTISGLQTASQGVLSFKGGTT